MDLGHLTNSVKTLSEIISRLPSKDWAVLQRTKFEQAIDLLYLEIGSRDTEIAQLTGIQKALQRSLERSKE